ANRCLDASAPLRLVLYREERGVESDLRGCNVGRVLIQRIEPEVAPCVIEGFVRERCGERSLRVRREGGEPRVPRRSNALVRGGGARCFTRLDRALQCFPSAPQ